CPVRGAVLQLCHEPIVGAVREEQTMTNTPPPTSNNNDDAVNATEPETPVFDEVATENPEVQDAAPDVVEPTSGQQDREQSASEQAAPASEPVPLVEPAAP